MEIPLMPHRAVCDTCKQRERERESQPGSRKGWISEAGRTPCKYIMAIPGKSDGPHRLDSNLSLAGGH